MIQTVAASVSSVRSMVGDVYGDHATSERVLGVLNTAQKMLFNEMTALPIIGRAVAIVVLPSIGLGTKSLSAHFLVGGQLEFLENIISMKERTTTATDESDWVIMTPTLNMPGFTAGSYNHIYHFTGEDIKLPGADQDLQVRIFGEFVPQAITSEASRLVPGTAIALEFCAARLYLNSRGNATLARTYQGDYEIQRDALFNRIVQEKQVIPIRQRSFSGRGRKVY